MLGKRILICSLLALFAVIVFWSIQSINSNYHLTRNEVGQSLQPDLANPYEVITDNSPASQNTPFVLEADKSVYGNAISTNNLNEKNDWVLGLNEGARELLILEVRKARNKNSW